MVDATIEDCERFVDRLLALASEKELRESGLAGASCAVVRVASDLASVWNAPNVRVTDTRVNGARLDVRMQSDDGRAWLAVIWLEQRPSPIALADVTVYERPPEFSGRPPGTVVVLNGPSSVGKSATMAAFAAAAPTPWACIDEPTFGRLDARFLAFPATAGPITVGFLAALASAARLGNEFVVSAAGIEQARFHEALAGVPTVYVGLHAPLAVLRQRQRTQADKFGGLAEGSMTIHDGWAYDLELDTTVSGPADIARAILAFLDRDAVPK